MGKEQREKKTKLKKKKEDKKDKEMQKWIEETDADYDRAIYGI